LNPFAHRIQTQEQWIMPVTAMSLVLGFMVSLSWVTESHRSERLERLDPDQRTRVATGAVDLDKFESLSTEVKDLREQKSKLEKAVFNQTAQGQLAEQEVQKAELLAGLTPLEGPGVQITLRDSTKGPEKFGGILAVTSDSIIHDLDVLKVVNELYATGAEAISVNGRRVVSGTSFRCVGTTILVDGVRIASPVVIRAIGDAQTLVGGMNLPGGVLSEIRQSDPAMVEMTPMKEIQLQPYEGTTQRKFGTVPKDPKEPK
jgi:uncharacterized protein YlxW (UPF0749 family)